MDLRPLYFKGWNFCGKSPNSGFLCASERSEKVASRRGQTDGIEKYLKM